MNVIDWLLDSDPAIRWQVLRDLTAASADEVAAERSRIATEGWGARLLELQGADGCWAGGACFPRNFDWAAWDPKRDGQPWTSTLPVLQLLYEFGIDPQHERVQHAIAQVRDHCRWEHDNQPFFEGEVEPCINGRTVALGAYFGQDIAPVVDLLLTEQLADGGWNCEAERGSLRSSFHTTICVLEGLSEYERVIGGDVVHEAACATAEDYLLERHLMRRLSTRDIIDPTWLEFAYPVHWFYDILRALDYFRATGAPPDPRMDEAIALLCSRQQPDGTLLLENIHPGAVHFGLEEGVGKPSRWNTLRALRVLRWAEQSSAQ